MNDDSTRSDQRQSDDHLPPNDPVVPADSVKDDQVRSETHHHSAERHQERWPNRMMALATIALVVITSFYTCYAGQQVVLLRESVKAAQDAAEVASSQLMSQREAVRLERRAWVFATQFTLSAQPAYAPHEAHVTISHTNTGQIPAMVKTQLWISVATLCSGFTEDDWLNSTRSPEIPLYPQCRAAIHT